MSPQLLASLRGYDRAALVRDLAAGFTVGIVALPLAIGFGIASGVTPAQGLWTAIIDLIGLGNICPNIDASLGRARALVEGQAEAPSG